MQVQTCSAVLSSWMELCPPPTCCSSTKSAKICFAHRQVQHHFRAAWPAGRWEVGAIPRRGTARQAETCSSPRRNFQALYYATQRVQTTHAHQTRCKDVCTGMDGIFARAETGPRQTISAFH